MEEGKESKSKNELKKVEMIAKEKEYSVLSNEFNAFIRSTRRYLYLHQSFQ